MKSTVRVVVFAMLVAPLLLSESFGADLRRMSTGSAMANRPKMLQTRFASKHVLLDPLPAGSYTIGVGGYFPTIDSAFRRLEGGGIAGAVTLLLTDTLYVAPFPPGDFRLIGPIAGAGAASRITIRPADNVAVRVEGSGTATLTIEDVSYLTLDGISLEGPTRLKIHASANTYYDWNDAVDFWGSCKHDTVQTLTAGSDRIHPWTTVVLLISKDTTTVDSCVVSGVSITSGGNGIGVMGYDPYINRPNGNVISGCRVGSPIDILLGGGIFVNAANGTLVENNHIENLQAVTTTYPYLIGIENFYSNYTVIRNSLIHGFRGTGAASIYGIYGSGDATHVGDGAKVYNNMIYDLQNRSTTDHGYIAGIKLVYNSNALIAYNSVWLDGISADPAGSDALALVSGITNVNVLNNILVNTVHITNAAGGSSALWSLEPISVTSDNNDLFVDTSFANSYVGVKWNGGILARTLSQWQGAGYDAHSVSVMPVFRGPHLHVDTTQAANEMLSNKGTPLGQVLTDIDGQPRDPVSPDIGADEFVAIVTGVATDKREVPGTFALEQNYPNPFNPTTVVSYQLSAASSVRLVVYDLLGREVEVLVNEQKAPGSYSAEFDGSKLASGVYLYRLSAGQFTQTRKMLLLK